MLKGAKKMGKPIKKTTVDDCKLECGVNRNLNSLLLVMYNNFLSGQKRMYWIQLEEEEVHPCQELQEVTEEEEKHCRHTGMLKLDILVMEKAKNSS